MISEATLQAKARPRLDQDSANHTANLNARPFLQTLYGARHKNFGFISKSMMNRWINDPLFLLILAYRWALPSRSVSVK
jgi:hypothetical protein